MQQEIEKVERLVQQGKEQYDSGKYLEAKHAFVEALAMNPHDSEVLNSLATTLCELNGGEWSEEAIEVLSRALAVNPQNVKAWNNHGDYHYRRGEFEEAIASFEKAVAIDPNYAVAHVNLSLSYRNLNRSVESLNAIRKAIILKPTCAWTRFQLALTYLYRGLRFDCADDLEKAREVFLSVREIDGKQYPAEKMVHMIDAYLGTLRKQKALQSYLIESTQYFGDKRDDETFGALLN